MATKLMTKDYLDEMLKNELKKDYIFTGLDVLDRIFEGFQEGRLYVLGGRPSIGKTALSLDILSIFPYYDDSEILYFSLVDSTDYLMEKLLGIYCQKTFCDIDDVEETEGKTPTQAVEFAIEHFDSRIWIDDTKRISIEKIDSLVRKMKEERNLKYVFIDYVQLLSTEKKYESRKEKMNAIYHSLSILAKETGCHIIVLSQVSIEVEHRPDKRPMISDIYDCEVVEKYADVIMIIYRDEYYNRESDYKGTTEIIIAKTNCGSTGTVLNRFSDYNRWLQFIQGRI